MGEVVVALLRADAGSAGQALQLQDQHAVEGAAEEDRRRHPLRHRRGRIKFVYDDGVRRYDDEEAVRRRDPQSGAPLQGNRMRVGARGAGTYSTDAPCDTCHGKRLKPEALCVKIGGKNIAEVVELSIRAAGDWFSELPKQLNAKQNEIAVRILKEIHDRLRFLVDVGLDYLTLGRALRHAVRRREPAHPPRLADRLGPDRRALRARRAVDRPAPARQRAPARNAARLRDLGNTVIVVEHDEDAIRTADHVIDIGPGAGIHGGHIIAEGTRRRPDQPRPAIITGKYLTGDCARCRSRSAAPRNAQRAARSSARAATI